MQVYLAHHQEEQETPGKTPHQNYQSPTNRAPSLCPPPTNRPKYWESADRYVCSMNLLFPFVPMVSKKYKSRERNVGEFVIKYLFTFSRKRGHMQFVPRALPDHVRRKRGGDRRSSTSLALKLQRGECQISLQWGM